MKQSGARPRRVPPRAARDNRAMSAPSPTSPLGVAASLARVAEAKQRLYGPKPPVATMAASDLAPFPPLPSKVNGRGEIALSPVQPIVPRRPRDGGGEPQSRKSAVALRNLAALSDVIARNVVAHSPAVKDAVRGLLETFRPAPDIQVKQGQPLSQRFELELAGELRRAGRMLSI